MIHECINNNMRYLRYLNITTRSRKDLKAKPYQLPYCIAPDDFKCVYKATIIHAVKKDEDINNPLCMFKGLKKIQL